MSKQSYRWRFM